MPCSLQVELKLELEFTTFRKQIVFSATQRELNNVVSAAYLTTAQPEKQKEKKKKNCPIRTGGNDGIWYGASSAVFSVGDRSIPIQYNTDFLRLNQIPTGKITTNAFTFISAQWLYNRTHCNPSMNR